MASLRRVIELDSKNAGAHNTIGTLLAGAGKNDEALAEYRRAADLDPRMAAPWYNIGWQMRSRGRGEEAADAFRRNRRTRAQELDAPQAAGGRAAGTRPLRRGRRGHAPRARPSPGRRRARRRIGGGRPSVATASPISTPSCRPSWRARHSQTPASGASWPNCVSSTSAGTPPPPASTPPHSPTGPSSPTTCGPGTARTPHVPRPWPPPGAAKTLATSPKWSGRVCGGRRWTGWPPTWRRGRARRPGGAAEARTQARCALLHWKQDGDLAGLREDDAVRELPEAERQACRQFWADVDAVLQKTLRPD